MREGRKMLDAMSSDEYEELYLASVRVPLVLAIFLGLWGLVILVLQALQIDFSSVLRKASGKWMGWFSWGAESLPALPCSQYCHAHMSRETELEDAPRFLTAVDSRLRPVVPAALSGSALPLSPLVNDSRQPLLCGIGLICPRRHNQSVRAQRKI